MCTVGESWSRPFVCSPVQQLGFVDVFKLTEEGQRTREFRFFVKMYYPIIISQHHQFIYYYYCCNPVHLTDGRAEYFKLTVLQVANNWIERPSQGKVIKVKKRKAVRLGGVFLQFSEFCCLGVRWRRWGFGEQEGFLNGEQLFRNKKLTTMY